MSQNSFMSSVGAWPPSVSASSRSALALATTMAPFPRRLASSRARSARSSSSPAVCGSATGRPPPTRSAACRGRLKLAARPGHAGAQALAPRRGRRPRRRPGGGPRTRRRRSGRCRRRGGTRRRSRSPRAAGSRRRSRCPCRSLIGLKLSRSTSRQASGRSARRARQISSLVRTWIAPWLSSPVSESVRAALLASSKASALLHATAARLGDRLERLDVLGSTGRCEKNATDSAPLSSPFQRIGTDSAVLTWAITSISGTLTSRPGSRW